MVVSGDGVRSCGWTAGLRVAAAAAGIGAALLIGAGVAAAHTGSADTESAGPTTSTSSAAAGDTAPPGAAHSRASATRTSPRPNAAPPSQNLGDDAATDTDAAVAPARRSATTLDKSAETGRRESLQAPNRREESVPQPTPRRHLRAEKTAPTVASPSAHTSPAAMASANSGASPDPAAASPRPAGPSAAADTQVVAQPVEAQPVAFETPALATTSVTRSTALSPVNAIGTLIFNALSAAARLFDPPPTIPPDSSVTRGTSTLTLPCDCAQTLKTDWYFPNQSTEPVGLIYLQHGFFRSKTNVSALAVALAERTNSVVVAPTVTSHPFAAGGYWINGEPMQHAIASLFTGDRAALGASASAAAGETVTLPTPFVIAGHSAGGNLAAAVAGFTTENGAVADLRAVIMFDGVDSVGAIRLCGNQTHRHQRPPHLSDRRRVRPVQRVRLRHDRARRGPPRPLRRCRTGRRNPRRRRGRQFRAARLARVRKAAAAQHRRGAVDSRRLDHRCLHRKPHRRLRRPGRADPRR